MGVLERARNPLFGRHGHLVVAGLCAYEVAAIVSGRAKRLPRLPTLTALGRRHQSVKWALTLALAHHWYIEEVVLAAAQDTVEILAVGAGPE